MSCRTLIAVDPGNSGAAVIRSAAGHVLDVVKFDGFSSIEKTIARAHDLTLAQRVLRVGEGSCIVALIERVWASPVMGVASSFAFGENYGNWCGALRTAGFPLHCVTPQAWQKVAAPDVRGQGDARKAALKELALVRFDLPVAEPLLPRGVRVTLTNCDALLLSEYGLHCLRHGAPLGEPL